MAKAKRDYRKILEHNVGFDGNTRWLSFARRHGFKAVRAARMRRCPDCLGRPKPESWGQYVYFSTLIRLLECGRCGLVWADAHLDPSVVRRHFDVVYKDDAYFRRSRSRIFRHMARVIDRLARPGARVLDIGGARGDLMAHLIARRPDLFIVVNDIAETSTRAASERFGFATLTGDARVLAEHAARYDVVVLSDVVYYEPDIRRLWTALGRLVAPGGCVVLRVPNKWRLMRLWQRWFRATRSQTKQRLQHRIRFFNPEHIFILRPAYLDRRLSRLGFHRIRILPSPLLAKTRTKVASMLAFTLASALYGLTGGALALTPSILAVGTDRRRQPTISARIARPRIVPAR